MDRGELPSDDPGIILVDVAIEGKEEDLELESNCTIGGRRGGRHGGRGGGRGRHGGSIVMRPRSSRAALSRAVELIWAWRDGSLTPPLNSVPKRRCARERPPDMAGLSAVAELNEDVMDPIPDVSIHDVGPLVESLRTGIWEKFYTQSTAAESSDGQVGYFEPVHNQISRPRSRCGIDVLAPRVRFVADLSGGGKAKEGESSSSIQAEGSGFVIAPNLQSANHSCAASMAMPGTSASAAAIDPLCYFNGLWRSPVSSANHEPRIGGLGVDHMMLGSEGFARPNPQGRMTTTIPNGFVGEPESSTNEQGHQHHSNQEVDHEASTAANDPPVTILGGISTCVYRKVRVKLIDMCWGGECIPNPCPYAVGSVLEVVKNPDGRVIEYLVDFGEYLGV